MVDIRSFRFVIPPFVVFAVIWLGIVIDPNANLALILQKLKFPLFTQGQNVTAFLTAIFFFFGMGFIISSLGIFMLRVSYWLCRWCHGPGVVWDKEAKAELEKYFKVNKLREEGEFYEHAILSLAPQRLSNFVTRRWEFFQTNLNSLLAVVLAILTIKYFLRIEPGC